jgi:DNA-binding XRE family transcriptional regulator
MDGRTLRTERLRRGMSRWQLAHEIGVPVETVAAWEDGDAAISCPHAVEQVFGDHPPSHRAPGFAVRDEERTIAAR